jgi:hypothetical protein
MGAFHSLGGGIFASLLGRPISRPAHGGMIGSAACTPSLCACPQRERELDRLIYTVLITKFAMLKLDFVAVHSDPIIICTRVTRAVLHLFIHYEPNCRVKGNVDRIRTYSISCIGHSGPHRHFAQNERLTRLREV